VSAQKCRYGALTLFILVTFCARVRAAGSPNSESVEDQPAG
jgi:hypothetical protein